MLMVQLQIFDKFNEHPKYLLQDLFKNNGIQYLHTTMSMGKKRNITCNACQTTHALSLSFSHH